MARQLRIEFAGGVYHITARGNARGDIFFDDQDRIRFLDYMANSVERYQWLCHGYCLMTNHYHLLMETPIANLSDGMQILNGRYAQYLNRRYRRAGHVFQGRFSGVIVEKENYLLELCRYIVLNPVRAEMVRKAIEWPWSSYRAMVGVKDKPEWLTTDWMLGCFGDKRRKAQAAYEKFVVAGKDQPSPFKVLKNQLYLGSEEFIENTQSKLDPDKPLLDIPRQQLSRVVKKPLAYYVKQAELRNDQMALAYRSGCYTQYEIAEYFGVSNATVSRAVKEYEWKM